MNKKFLSAVLSASMLLAPLGGNSCFAAIEAIGQNGDAIHINCTKDPTYCEKFIGEQGKLIMALYENKGLLEEQTDLLKGILEKKDEQTDLLKEKAALLEKNAHLNGKKALEKHDDLVAASAVSLVLGFVITKVFF